MNNSNQSDAVIRATRVSVLIVDICASLFRDIISYELKKRNLTLADYLATNKNSIENNKMFYFFDKEILFIKKLSSEKFDISLCNKLIIVLLPKDHQAIKQLKSIVKIRNENYGHLYKFGFEKKKFKSVYKELKDCIMELSRIFGMPSRETQVDELENRSFNESDQNRYKDYMMNLMHKDHDYFSTILAAIKEGDKKQNEIFKKLCSGGIKTADQLSDLRNELHNLFKIVTKNDYESLLNETIRQGFESVETIIKSNHNIQTTIASNYQIELNEKLSDISNQLKSLNLDNMVNCKYINLTDFQAYFDESSSEFNFRILIISIDDSIYENELKEKGDFFKAIAFASWNLIIDLNPQSRMIQELQAQLATKKNYIKVDFDVNQSDLVRQVNSDMSRTIRKGSHKCYLAVNLSEDNNDFERLQAFAMNFESEDFLKHITDEDNSIMCTNLILKQTDKQSYLNHIEEINKSIRGVIFRRNKNDSLQLIHLVLSDLHEEVTPEIRKILENKVNKIERKCCIATLDQFLCANKGNFLLESTADFTLPAAKGTEINWSRKDNTNYSAFFKVYHKEIGSWQPSNEEIRHKVIDFITGNELDPETIFINDEYEINDGINKTKKTAFIETHHLGDFLKNTIDSIRKDSQREEFFINNKLVKQVKYAPHCGGTSLGRILLYRLRNTLPAIHLLSMNTNTDTVFEGLKQLSVNSSLPLVILIDTDCTLISSVDCAKRFSLEDAESLSLILRNKSIRHFIIFVNRHIKYRVELDQREVDMYEKLYTEYLTYIDKSNNYTIRERSLIAIRLHYLQKDIAGIKEIAESYLNRFSEIEKELVVIMHIMEEFTTEYLSGDLVAFLLDISGGKTELVKKFNRSISLTEQNPSSRPILSILKRNSSHYYRLLNTKLGEAISDLVCEGKKYERFNEAFQKRCSQVLAESSDGVKSNLAKIAGQLLIPKYEQHTKEDRPDKFLSGLVAKFKEHLGEEATEQALNEYYEIFSKDAASSPSVLEVSIRIGIVSARFMFFHRTEVKDKEIKYKDASIAKIKRVLDIKQPLNATSDLYKRSEYMCSYAELLRHYINANIKQKSKSNDELMALFDESIRAYGISSREASNKNVQALIGECKTRERLLSYLSGQFDDKKKYTEMLESKETPAFIRSSEVVIQEILDLLITLHKEQTSFKFDYNQLFNRCRTGVLKLRNGFKFDLASMTTKRYDLCVDYVSYKSLKWQDNIDIGELKQIIDYNEACLKTATEQKIQKPYAFLLRNTVLAYIHLAQFANSPLSNEYHIDRAISLAVQWKRFYEDIDPDSLFYCGIFTFMKAVKRNDISDFRLANDLFKSCRSAYQARPSLKFKIPMYFIGKNTSTHSLGLTVIDKDDKVNEKKLEKLEVFKGEVSTENCHGEEKIHYIKFKSHKILCAEKNALNKEDIIRTVEIGQKILYEFHIGIKRSGLFAYKYRKAAE